MTVGLVRTPDTSLAPYVSDLETNWPDGCLHRQIEGTLASVDLTGFTSLTERLSVLGREGGEELTRLVNAVFEPLIELALAEGGDIVNFGGDALLLLFAGRAHAERACRSLAAMQRWIGSHGGLDSSRGRVRLRMSAGAHSGHLTVVCVGDSPQALVIVGSDASKTVALENAAGPGQVLVSPQTAALIDARWSSRSDRIDARALRRASVPPSHSRDGEKRRTRGTDLRWIDPAVARFLLVAQASASLRLASIAFVELRALDAVVERRGGERLCRDVRTWLASSLPAGEARQVSLLTSDVGHDCAKFVLVAGVPESREDDEGHLLRAARALTKSPPCAGVAVAAGVTLGHVFAGDLGHPVRRTYTVMGDAVNVAARMAAAAPSGSVLVTEPVLRAPDTRFAAEALPTLEVRGRRGHVRPYRLGAPHPRTPHANEAALVGRERELEILRRALRQAQAGRGARVQIVADRGMGKTHLLQVFLADAGTTRIGRGAGDPYSVSEPFFAIAPALAQLFDLARKKPTIGSLRRLVASRDRTLIDVLPLLGEALRIEVPETAATRRLHPSFRSARRAEVVARWMALLGPGLVVVVDDFQWADPASAHLVDALGRAAGERGWLVVTAGRTGSGESQRAPGEVRLELSPLSPRDARALLLSRVPGEGVTEDTLERAMARAAGHPLILAELAGTSLGDDTDSVGLSVERLASAMIDELPVRDRMLLRAAAVAGREFDQHQLIGALSGSTVEVALGEPVRWAALERFVAFSGSTGRFRQEVFREIAYASLPARQRTEIHRLIAEDLLRRLTPAEMKAAAARIALHFAGAGRHREGVRYASIGARQLAAVAAWAESASLLRLALRCARASGVANPAAIARIRLRLSYSLEQLGRLPEARDALPPRSGGEHRLDGEVGVARARLLQRLGRFRAALAATTLALADADASRAVDIKVAALVRRAGIQHVQGRYREAMSASREALDLAATARQRGGALLTLAMTQSSLGLVDAMETGREAARLLRRVQDDLGLGNLLLNMGADSVFHGRWRPAVVYYAQARDAFTRCGDQTGGATVANNLAELLVLQGRVTQAQPVLREARRVFLAAEDPYTIAVTESLQGTIEVMSGMPAAGLDRLRAARGVFDQLGAAELSLDADLRSAEAHLALSQTDAAGQVIGDCQLRAAALGSGGMNARWAGRLQAIALAQMGRLDEALDLALALAAEARRLALPAEVLQCAHIASTLRVRMGLDDDVALREELTRLVATLDVVELRPLPISASRVSAPRVADDR